MARLLEHRRAAPFLFALGMLLRCVFLAEAARHPLASDSASYFAMARTLAAGRHFIPFWPPALPLYLAALARTVSASELAARAGMLLFYAALAVVVVCFGRLRSLFASNVALLLLAVSPGFVFLSTETLSELPAALLVTLLVYLLVRVPRNPLAFGAAVGAVLGCLTLLRPSSMLLAAAVPVLLAVRTRRVWPAVLAGITVAAMVLGWTAFVYRTTGRVVAINTSNAKNLYLGNNLYTPLYRTWWLGSHHELEDRALALAGPAQADPIEQDHQLNRAAWSYIRAQPLLFAVRTFNRICVFAAPDTFAGSYLLETYRWPAPAALAWLALDTLFWFAIATGAVAFCCTPALSRSPAMRTAAIVGLLYAAPYALAFSHPRYHLPLEPLAMLATAVVMDRWVHGNPDANPLRVGRFALRRFSLVLALFAAVQLQFVAVMLAQVFRHAK